MIYINCKIDKKIYNSRNLKYQTKNQLKQPLKNPIKNTPIFTENDIKTKIRTDLGYERILP